MIIMEPRAINTQMYIGVVGGGGGGGCSGIRFGLGGVVSPAATACCSKPMIETTGNNINRIKMSETSSLLT